MERFGKDVLIRRLGSQIGLSKTVELALEYVLSIRREQARLAVDELLDRLDRPRL
jgi:hypothetical protein